MGAREPTLQNGRQISMECQDGTAYRINLKVADGSRSGLNFPAASEEG